MMYKFIIVVVCLLEEVHGVFEAEQFPITVEIISTVRSFVILKEMENMH